MATFVVVRRVVLAPAGAILFQARHEVFTPTLTGVGERSHLLTPNVDLDIHILDVVNEMKWQELKNVVLVGQLAVSVSSLAFSPRILHLSSRRPYHLPGKNETHRAPQLVVGQKSSPPRWLL